jgi:hypothetical protein
MTVNKAKPKKARQDSDATELRPLDWTEMLNEEAVWHDFSDFVAWYSGLAPGSAVPDADSCLKFREDLSFLREQAARIYFDEHPDIAAINDRLKSVSLEIDTKVSEGTRLPCLLAKGAGGFSESGILERLFGAFLVGFAQFVADRQRGGPGLCRCQGVFRDSRREESELPAFEKRYRSEIDLLEEQELVNDPGIQRCADFFVGRAKARFCSDTCRFVTFQISKQLKDPNYLAEKQRRYRNKLKS